MIWSKEETMPRDELEALQLERLKETVKRVYDKVPPYRKKMEKANVKPEDIKTLKDLAKLPFVTKQDMRDNYPFGLFAVDRDSLVRIHASSGTTGKPTVVGYTENDLKTWTECVSRIACMGGASSHDTAQICFGYGMFTGALGLHYGLEKIGAAIVPSSTGNSQKQIMYMQDFETSLLVATPSYALRLAEVAKEMGIEPAKDLKVKIALVGSELLTDAMREEMHKVWGKDILITSNYGMSELMGPGVSGECLMHCGMHINEDYFIPEIIDPKTGEVLPAGEQGSNRKSNATKRKRSPPAQAAQGTLSFIRNQYRGYFSQSPLTTALHSSAVPSKSVASSLNRRAMTFMSSSLRPRVVTAGVPTRTPEVTKGFSGSLGMAFLLTVMCTSSRRFSISLPVMCMGRRSTSMRWLSVPPETRSKPSATRASARALALRMT